MFKSQYDKEKQIFSISINNKPEFDLQFVDLIPKNAKINVFDGITSIVINNDFIITIFDKKSDIEFVFQKNTNIDDNINIKLFNTSKIKTIDKNTNFIKSRNSDLYLIVQDTQFTECSENSIVLDGSPAEMRLLISATPKTELTKIAIQSINSNSDNFKAMELSEPYIYKVQIGQPIPEFSITLYDDSNYTVLRPLFNGNPVLSTIAVDPTKSDITGKMGDSHFYTYGFGPATRTTYIQVNCNVDVETPDIFELYMANVNPQLRIYKISTGDLLVSKELTTKSYTNNKYRYRTVFEVLENWGSDELLLIDVFLKIRIYDFLPMTFSIGQSGTNEQPLYNIFTE